MTYRYMISYMVDGGRMFGGIDVTLDHPIASRHDVLDVEGDLLAHLGVSRVLVLGFSLYTDPQGR